MIGHDKIEHASLTDVGVRRSHNQDMHAVLPATDLDQWRERGHVFIVADGMGAHAVGEMASELAVNLVPHTYYKHAQQGAVAALRKAFVEANASIHNKGQQNREFEGMGTTTTALVLREEGAWIGHVGDSRAYRVRDGTIEQLTFDHSLQWELARRQGVDPNGLHGIPSNVIVRSLGPEAFVTVDVEGPHPIHDGDVFLLCSDGLSGQVSDSEMGSIVTALPPAEACRFLVDLANLRGGPDNITVVVVRVGNEAAPPPPKPVRKSPLPEVPWPFCSLFLGVLLAAGAAILTINKEFVWGTLAIVLALAAIVAGLIGLGIHHKREQRRMADEPDEPPRPRVHRQAACRVEKPATDRLAKAAATLKQQLVEKNWEVDWPTFQLHFDKAEAFAKQGSYADAFREYCRSMLPLNEAVKKYRGKGEEFRPNWDKEP